MSKVLVTGGAGWLGRSVVAGLAAAGHEVVSVDMISLPGMAAEQRIVDLTDAGNAYEIIARQRPEAIVHLAAIAIPFSAPEHRILARNTALAFNVMQAAVDLQVPKIITASSPTIIGYGAPGGWIPERFPLDEEIQPRPWNAYALSKHIAEQIAGMFAAKAPNGARFAAFRPCYVTAPEEWIGGPTQQGHTVRERLDDPALSAPALFNYLDARDAADFVLALLAGMDSIPNAQTFFVGAADALARQPLAELIPLFYPGTEHAAASLTGTSPAFSIAKAERLLGWTPRRSWRTELAEAAVSLETA